MKTIYAFLLNVLGVSIGFLFLLVLFQVVARVFLRMPTSWSVELGRILFAIIVFYGSAILIYEKRHMKVTTLLERLPANAGRVLEIIRHIIVLAFLFAFSYGSLGRGIRNIGVRIPTLEWMTTGYLYLIVMGSGLFMLAFTLRELLHTIRGARR